MHTQCTVSIAGDSTEPRGAEVAATSLYSDVPKSQSAGNLELSLPPAQNESEEMGEHDSYHQAITRKEALRRLKKCTEHGYLTRYCEEQKCYVLSVHQKLPNGVFKEFKIECENSVYCIYGKSKKFNNIGELLEYYEEKRIDPALKNIGKYITEKNFMDANKCVIS